MRPTKDLITSRLSDLKSHYSQRNVNFDLDDKYYELQFRDDLGLPEEYKKDGLVLPTSRDIVDAGASHISTAYARFFRPLRGSSVEAREQAEMLRKLDTGLFYRTKTDHPISPWIVAAKHGCLYGMWCFEVVYDPYSPDEPEEGSDNYEEQLSSYNQSKHDHLCISIRAIHPRNVFPDTSEEPQFVIIEEPKTVMQAKLDWPRWTPPLNKKEVTQIVYWDSNYRAIYIDGEPVLPSEDGIIPHDYGFIPCAIGYSGLGNVDKSAKPEKRAVGLIRYLRNPLKAQSFAYSVHNIIMKAHSWPITFVSGPGAEALATIKLKFGKIYEKPIGVTIEEYVKAPPPEFVMNHLAYTSSVLAASGAPAALRGLAEEGVRSATHYSEVVAQASAKYNSIMEQMQNSTALVMSMATRIVERVVPENIHIWARTPDEEVDIEIDKRKIKHHYTTYCEFTPISPEEEARRHADMMNLVKTGILSLDTGRRRYLTHIDPEAEAIKAEAEKLRSHPLVQQALAELTIQELGLEAGRLAKIQQLKQRKKGLASGKGQAQAVSVGMRPPPKPAPKAVPGSVEDLARAMSEAGIPSTGGGLAVPGTPIRSPTPYGEVR